MLSELTVSVILFFSITSSVQSQILGARSKTTIIEEEIDLNSVSSEEIGVKNWLVWIIIGYSLHVLHRKEALHQGTLAVRQIWLEV